MKITRTPLERYLLTVLKELEEDVRKVKTNYNSKTNINKIYLCDKVKIVQSELNKFRRIRRPKKTIVDEKIPNTKSNARYIVKLNKMIEKFNENNNQLNYFIQITKKDITKNRITPSILRDLLKSLGDLTWTESDYKDTLEKIKSGISFGIGYIKYNETSKRLNLKNVYLTTPKHDFMKGEYIDVFEENLNFYKKHSKTKTITLKKALKKQKKSSL